MILREPIAVEAFAHRVLQIARALVGEHRWDLVEPLLETEVRRPPGLSAAAVDALEDTLARGCVRELARRGGWVPRRLMVAGTPEKQERRAWERHDALPLRFSRASVDWLIGLAAVPRLADDPPPMAPPETAADELLLYLLCDRIERARSATGWVADLLRASPLCWLGFPDLLVAPARLEQARATRRGRRSQSRSAPPPPTPPSPIDFAAWADGPAVAITEALQSDLTRRWLAMEVNKRRVRSIDRMIAIGCAQEEVLDAWCDACDAAGRRDLLTFAIETAEELLARPVPPRSWIARLEDKGTLARRGMARRAAGAFLRSLERLERWDEEHRMVRHFEDDYETAQLLLRSWETVRGARIQHAHFVLEALDRAVAPSSDTVPGETAPAAEPEDPEAG